MSIGKNTVAGEQLRNFVERLENIDGQKAQLSKESQAIMAEAKAQGFIPAGIRYVLKVRKDKPSVRQEKEAIADSYLHALGMAPDTPLFRSVGLMSVDLASREQVIEALSKFVPAGGSITIEAGGSPVRLTRGADGAVTAVDIVEKPTVPAAAPRASPSADVPDVSDAAAYELGSAAFRADLPIVANPFPFGDSRRPKWDKGWRDASGTDGMGPAE